MNHVTATDEIQRSAALAASEGTERPAAPRPHREPSDLADRFALGLTRLLRFFADRFFATALWSPGDRAGDGGSGAGHGGRDGHPPAMSARMVDDDGWIRTLMEEAENERMHLMTFIEVARPTALERS
jgi:ubiquinol oxidase